MQDMLDEILGLSSGKGRIRMGWRIDPSGEIRDSLTDRLLPEVKVTASSRRRLVTHLRCGTPPSTTKPTRCTRTATGSMRGTCLRGSGKSRQSWRATRPRRVRGFLCRRPRPGSTSGWSLSRTRSPTSSTAGRSRSPLPPHIPWVVGLRFPTPTRADHTFLGWYTNAEFTGDKVESIPLTAWGDLKLYAKWTSWDATSMSLTKPSTVPAYNGTVTLKGQLKTGASALAIASSSSSVGSDHVVSRRHRNDRCPGLCVQVHGRPYCNNDVPSEFRLRWRPSRFLSSGLSHADGVALIRQDQATRQPVLPLVRHRQADSHSGTRSPDYRWRRTVTGKWKSYGYVYCAASSYTYSLKHRFPSKGKWRLQVVHVADANNALTRSGFTVFTVK